MCNWPDKTILIVDDIKMNQILLKYMLDGTNVKLLYVDNSKEFYKIIDRNNIDLILMDINLNEVLTGIDLIKYLQNNNYQIPVIIQSANECDNKEVIVADCIRKPINPNLLKQKINKIFNSN